MIVPEYSLSESNASPDPFDLFHLWYSERLDTDPDESGVVALATSEPGGRVSARIVLMKHYDKDGFVFYTNYESRKADQLKVNPYAALLFYWPELSRQIRIEGVVEKVPAQMSDEYFRRRPRGSRISAIASNQSRIVPDKKSLLDKVSFIKINNKGKELVRPGYWGGYRLTPDSYEFWLEGRDRLHDRISYTLNNGIWTICRLAP